MCFGHLSGRGPMDVSLEAYYEDDRGAWVNSSPPFPKPSDGEPEPQGALG